MSSHTYDAHGIRQRQVADGITNRFLVDPTHQYAQVLEELDSNGNPMVTYVIGHERISRERAEGLFTYHGDGLGSIRHLTDENGLETDRFVYEAYGLLEHREGSTPNTFRYTGEHYDPNLGFYYLRARYYDPTTGRFPTMDTFAGFNTEPGTLHKYLYNHSDPVNRLDPSGHLSLVQIGAGVSLGLTLRLATSHVAFGSYQKRAHGRSTFFHDYKTDQITICTKQEVNWCSVEEVWRWMRRMPAPRYLSNAYLARPLKNNDKTCCIGGAFPLFFGGQIRVEIGEYFVNNVTTTWHALAWGRVDRTAFESGGAVKIRTRGWGENRHGFIAWANDRIGPGIFNSHDQAIRRQVLGGPLR